MNYLARLKAPKLPSLELRRL